MAERVDMNSFVKPVELDPTPYLGESWVFTEALSRQRDLRTQRFASIREARQIGRALCEQLDILAAKAGLLTQPAILASPELYLPSTTIEPVNGTEYMRSVLQENDPLDLAEARGIFIGFGASTSGEFEKPTVDGSIVEESDLKLTSARVSIHYQLQVGSRINTLNLVGGVPCAHAAVDVSTLDFTADKRRREATIALGTLTELPFPEAQFFAHNLDSLLEPDERRYYILRSLGRMVRFFVAQHREGITERHKDAILDFLQARLGLYHNEPLEVQADYAISIPQSNKTSMVNKANLTSSVSDLSFAPHAFYGATEKARFGEHAPLQIVSSNALLAPAIVIPWYDHRTDQDTYLQIPFEYIRHLQPISKTSSKQM